MEPKDTKNIPNAVHTLYQKALHASRKGNDDYAVKLLKTAVLKEPGFLDARKELRRLESIPRENSMIKKAVSSVKVNKYIKVGQMKLAVKSINSAIENVEEALAIEITPSGLSLLEDIGRATDSDFIILEAVDLSVLLFSKNVSILRNAAEVYREYKLGKKEVEVRKKITALLPDDLKERMLLREASAMETMETSDWENRDKSYRDKLKDIDESNKLESHEKIITNQDDADSAIKWLKSELDESPDDIKLIRELGDAYLKGEYFQEAIETLEKLQDIKKSFDVGIDTKIEKATIGYLKKHLANYESYDETELSENQLDEKNKIINNIKAYRRNFAINRVQKFPNDLQLRYALALILWENNEIDDAIEQFQLSQNNLNRKIDSLIFLGKCFIQKGQFDIAADQFQKVLDEPRRSTEEEFEALYNLGIVYEKLEKPEKAAKCFKTIYSTKSTYKDVSERLKKYYN